MIDTLAATAASRPYGIHAATRGATRTVIPHELKGRGAHRRPRPANPTEEREPLVVSAPLIALVVFLVALMVTIGLALSFASSANDALNERPTTVSEYEAGLTAESAR